MNHQSKSAPQWHWEEVSGSNNEAWLQPLGWYVSLAGGESPDWTPEQRDQQDKQAMALIQAAPQLLDACQAALEWATSDSEDAGPASIERLAEVVAPQLEAAIAKAKGGK